eukprot:2514086-Rhodomonas_salina.4
MGIMTMLLEQELYQKRGSKEYVLCRIGDDCVSTVKWNTLQEALLDPRHAGNRGGSSGRVQAEGARHGRVGHDPLCEPGMATSPSLRVAASQYALLQQRYCAILALA